MNQYKQQAEWQQLVSVDCTNRLPLPLAGGEVVDSKSLTSAQLSKKEKRKKKEEELRVEEEEDDDDDDDDDENQNRHRLTPHSNSPCDLNVRIRMITS